MNNSQSPLLGLIRSATTRNETGGSFIGLWSLEDYQHAHATAQERGYGIDFILEIDPLPGITHWVLVQPGDEPRLPDIIRCDWKYDRSSVVRRIRWSFRSQAVEVTFVSGSVYRYYGVTTSLVWQWLGASSLGGFYHEFVRGEYVSVQIETRPVEGPHVAC
jgi:hypothetical protein